MSTERTMPPGQGGVVEEVEVHGHIIDSLLLPKILDRILQMGGAFEILECRIGARRIDPSHARIAASALSASAQMRISAGTNRESEHDPLMITAGRSRLFVASRSPDLRVMGPFPTPVMAMLSLRFSVSNAHAPERRHLEDGSQHVARGAWFGRS